MCCKAIRQPSACKPRTGVFRKSPPSTTHFQFATRRILDYLAKDIAAAFNVEVRGIYKLTTALRSSARPSDKVQARWNTGLESLADMLEPLPGENVNVRNRVAHIEHVDGGNVGIARRSAVIDSPEWKTIEIRLVGGGEGLFPWTSEAHELSRTDDGIVTQATLFPLLAARLDRIVLLIRRMYEVLPSA
jgi:hypothetical protein